MEVMEASFGHWPRLERIRPSISLGSVVKPGGIISSKSACTKNIVLVEEARGILGNHLLWFHYKATKFHLQALSFCLFHAFLLLSHTF